MGWDLLIVSMRWQGICVISLGYKMITFFLQLKWFAETLRVLALALTVGLWNIAILQTTFPCKHLGIQCSEGLWVLHHSSMVIHHLSSPISRRRWIRKHIPSSKGSKAVCVGTSWRFITGLSYSLKTNKPLHSPAVYVGAANEDVGPLQIRLCSENWSFMRPVTFQLVYDQKDKQSKLEAYQDPGLPVICHRH